jgi:hypothetical protein
VNKVIDLGLKCCDLLLPLREGFMAGFEGRA